MVMSVSGPDGVFRHSGCARKHVFVDPVYVGLAVCAHDNKLSETAEFAAVRLTPVTPVAGKPRLNSTLEIVPVGSKDRQAVYHSTTHFESPNWSPDGSHFVFNSQGSLFRLPVKGGTPEPIDTGSARHCNNDHGFSPDGKQLAISHHAAPDGKSLVYILPATGAARGGSLLRAHRIGTAGRRTARRWRIAPSAGATSTFTQSRLPAARNGG